MGVRRSNPKRPQQRYNSKVNMKIVAIAISLASLVHGEGLFLSNALDGVEIKLRGRDRGPDITQVELYIRPNEVAASGEVPTLEYKEEDGCWKEAPAKAGPTKRGGGLTCPLLARLTNSGSPCAPNPALNIWNTQRVWVDQCYTWWNKPDSSRVPRKIYRWAATTPSSGTQCPAPRNTR